MVIIEPIRDLQKLFAVEKSIVIRIKRLKVRNDQSLDLFLVELAVAILVPRQILASEGLSVPKASSFSASLASVAVAAQMQCVLLLDGVARFLADAGKVGDCQMDRLIRWPGLYIE